MNSVGVFGAVALLAGVGAVAGAMTLGKNKGRGRAKGQMPYAAIGSGLLATGTAAVLYNTQTCPPCPAGQQPSTAITPPPNLTQGGYTAAVGFAAIVGGVAGAMAVGKQKPSKLLGQQPYAPIGAALGAAAIAAIFNPVAPTCPPCQAIPGTTGFSTPTTPGTTANPANLT
jgi:hypothetical protein